MKLVEGAPEGFQDILLRVPVSPGRLGRDDLCFSRINPECRGPLPADCKPDELVEDIAGRIGFVMEGLDLGEVEGEGVSFVGGKGEFLVSPFPSSDFVGEWGIECIGGVLVSIRRELGSIELPGEMSSIPVGELDECDGCEYVGQAVKDIPGGLCVSFDNGGKFFILKPKASSGCVEQAVPGLSLVEEVESVRAAVNF